ncbi:MAG: ABC transporter permease [Pseudonocardiales bacterium]|nr:MAG: ABC transporter permease [Pseudonocardiales bacterium]
MTTLYAADPTPMVARPTPLRRLTRIELRKATDTRSGRLLLAATAALAVAIALGAALAGKRSGHTYASITDATSTAVFLLLPVVGILLITAEWSQRTALTTFTLVPRRGRVVAAKLAAAVVLGLLAGVVVIAVAAAATSLASHQPGSDVWHASAHVAVGTVLVVILNMLLGTGFGLLFRNGPLAIVINFTLPTAWSILVTNVHALHAARDWVDTSTAWHRLTEAHLSATTIGQAIVAASVWVAVPIAIGTARLRRRSIS